jgi:uncharacterized membrane protein
MNGGSSGEMKGGSWSDIPHLVLLAAMFLAAALTWPSAPERIPVHWDLAGEVDRYGGKLEGLLGVPLVALGIYLLMRFLPRIDPGRANYALFAGAYAVLRFVVLALLAGIYGLVHLVIRGHPVRMGTVMPLFVGALFVVVGGLLGKIRPNWFVGIRTPWTLSSKAAWTRTHRLGGWLFLVTGLATLGAAAVGPRAAFAVLFTGGLVTAAVSMVYSYLVWRSDPDKIPPAGTLPADET